MAVWALANLGEGLKRFDRMALQEKDAAIDALDAAGNELGRTSWSGPAVQYLGNRRDGRPDNDNPQAPVNMLPAPPDPNASRPDAIWPSSDAISS